MGTRKATISVPTDPRNLFAKETRDRIAAPSPPSPPPFLRTRDHRIGKSSSAVSCNYHPTDKGVRVRFWRIHTLHTHSHRVSGNHHPSFPPSPSPPAPPLPPPSRQQSQSRPLRRTRVRAGLAACGSHFGARSPGVERYRSVPDRKATGFSPRLIRSFSWFRLFTLLVLLVISPPTINGTTIHSN